MRYEFGNNNLDISKMPADGGDDINSGFQKVIALFTDLFSKLNNDFTKATPLEVNGAADQSKIVTPFSLGKGQSGGVASLNGNSKLSGSQLPVAALADVDTGTGNDKAVTPESLAKGQAGGVASLGADGKVKSSELPGLGKVYSGTATDIEILALIEVGDLYIRKG